MYPFIHIGPITLGTYGLMVAIALICAFLFCALILRAAAFRRTPKRSSASRASPDLPGRGFIICLKAQGIFRRSVAAAFQHDGFCFFRRGDWRIHRADVAGVALPDKAFAHAGRRRAGGRAGLWNRAHRLPDFGRRRLRYPHVAALGHEFSERHCARPPQRVHPTPIYEFLAALLIFWILWRLGARCFQNACAVRDCVRGVSCAHRDRKISRRNHSHQSAVVLRDDERAGGERRFDYCGDHALHVPAGEERLHNRRDEPESSQAGFLCKTRSHASR